MNKISNLSEDEAMTELIDEVYSKRPSFRIKLIQPSNHPEKSGTESKITEELMENTKKIMKIMNLLEPEVRPALTQQPTVNTPQQSIIFQQAPVLQSISEQPSLSQKVSVLQTIPEQSTRFMPRRKLDESTKITEHYETLIPLNLGRIKNFREEEKIDFGSLVQNVNQKVFFGKSPDTTTRNISPEPTNRVKNGKIEPEAEFKQEPSLAVQRYSSPLWSEPVESFDLNPTFTTTVTDSLGTQDSIQDYPGVDSKYSIQDYPGVDSKYSIQDIPGVDSKYEEEYYYLPNDSDSRNPDFFYLGEIDPYVHPTVSNSPVYSTESNSPVYPTGISFPVYPTGSNSPVFPTESNSPVYPTGSNSPVYPTGSNSPVYSAGTNSPVYPTGSNSPVYSTGTNSPLYNYETQVNSGFYSNG